MNPDIIKAGVNPSINNALRPTEGTVAQEKAAIEQQTDLLAEVLESIHGQLAKLEIRLAPISTDTKPGDPPSSLIEPIVYGTSEHFRRLQELYYTSMAAKSRIEQARYALEI